MNIESREASAGHSRSNSTLSRSCTEIYIVNIEFRRWWAKCERKNNNKNTTTPRGISYSFAASPILRRLAVQQDRYDNLGNIGDQPLSTASQVSDGDDRDSIEHVYVRLGKAHERRLHFMPVLCSSRYYTYAKESSFRLCYHYTYHVPLLNTGRAA